MRFPAAELAASRGNGPADCVPIAVFHSQVWRVVRRKDTPLLRTAPPIARA
jgi:hypothetical protein